MLTTLEAADGPMSGVKLRDVVRCKTSTLSSLLARLDEDGKIAREGQGWTLSVPTTPKGDGKGKRS